MAQLSNLINCQVRVVTGLCKVYEYEETNLSTLHALEKELDRFGEDSRVRVRASGIQLFSTPQSRVS